MKPKTLIMMGIAVVCGLVASYLTTLLYAKNQQKVMVLVAKEKMGQWAVVKNPDEKFQEKEILVNDAPKSAITADKKSDIVNRTLRKNIEEGDVLTAEDLLPKDKTSLEAQLTPGKRAWAVKITADSAAGGFVLPGSHVDVVHVSREGNRGSEAKLVLENVLVRAIDLLPVRPEDRPGVVGGTATLELTPEEILDLAKVQGTGSLMLSLRPYGDTGAPAKESYKKPEEVAHAPAIAPPPPPPEAEKTDGDKGEAKPQVQEPETYTKTMTVFNGSGWVQRVYVLDKKTNEVISSEIREKQDALKGEPKAEPKAAPAETKSEEKSTN